MHREILIAILPCLLGLIVSLSALALIVRVSGVSLQKVNWRRLQTLHRCQDGGVQSLALVVTFPIFVTISLFVVQISQLMIAVIVVNYAAFAAARSATVWIPAESVALGELEQENVLPFPAAPAQPIVLSQYHPQIEASAKYQKIFTAAALACALISPSRDLQMETTRMSRQATEISAALYRSLVPDSTSNSRLPARLHNKMAYSFANTAVRLEFADKNSLSGPSYNIWHPVTMEDGTLQQIWQPNEVGWQDPLTVTVTYNFALLPGPGRFLAKHLVRADGRPDRVSSRIQHDAGTYMTLILASATMTNEGFKSVVPYAQQPN